MFFIFIRACKKYKFSFMLNTHGDTTLILKPTNTFESINISREHFDCGFNALFLKAIKEMKRYREKEVHHGLSR